MKPTIYNRVSSPWFSEALDYFVDRPLENLLVNSPLLPDNNFRQTADGYVLKVAVPGMSRKDLQLEVDNQVLTVQGQKQRKDNSGWFTKTTTYQSTHFYKNFVLPEDADTDKIRAKCANGLLKITIPKIKSAGTKKVIPVNGTLVPEKSKWSKIAQPIKAWWTKAQAKWQQLKLKF